MVSFITTRVRDPSKQDWKKLVHLFKYLRGTQDIPLILRADGSGILKWYVDASHGVHPNMRGHTGGGLTMGTVFPVSDSTKQKLNTRRSTETEIVGVDGFMSGVCWSFKYLNPVPEESRNWVSISTRYPGSPIVIGNQVKCSRVKFI